MKKICIIVFYLQVWIGYAQTVGVITHQEETFQGYSLLNPLAFDTTYLINNCGNVVKKWPSSYQNGMFAQLTGDATLYKSAIDPNNLSFSAGGASGLLQEYDWDGNLLWHYKISNDSVRLHHDVKLMNNGNLLVIAWELKTAVECIVAGRAPGTIGSGEMWFTAIYEVKPLLPDSAEVVWEWHAWDHLVQDLDSQLENFGVVSNEFRKLDINKGNPQNTADWAHVNSIDYNEELDQILLSSPMFNELWVIDHSTTITEAATSIGGNSGNGGDLLWRWGNPASYDAGESMDQQLFFQHNATWVHENSRFANQISVFSNRDSINGELASKVKMINCDFNTVSMSYPMVSGIFLPLQESYVYDLVDTLFSPRLSGAQVLPNDHLLICSGSNGHLIEIDTNETVVWEYLLPIRPNSTFISQGVSPSNVKSLFTVQRYSSNFEGFNGISFEELGPIELNPIACQYSSTNLLLSDEISVFPNPVEKQLEFIGISSEREILIGSISGQKIYSGIINEGTIINTSTWKQGVYFIWIENSSQPLKIIKQ